MLCRRALHLPFSIKEKTMDSFQGDYGKAIPKECTPLFSIGSPHCPDDSWADSDPPFRFFGVPFSWEHLPGIPKKQTPDRVDHSLINHLPLPPSIASTSPKKIKFEDKKRDSSGEESFWEDPFFAALIQCSKGDDEALSSTEIWSGPKAVSKCLSDRFGLVSLYSSCKRTLEVSDSLVYLPKSTGNPVHQLATSHRLSKYK